MDSRYTITTCLLILAAVVAGCDRGADPTTTANGRYSDLTEGSITYDEARQRFGADMIVPTYVPPGLDSPDDVQVDMQSGGLTLTLLYQPTSSLPPASRARFLAVTEWLTPPEEQPDGEETIRVEGVNAFITTESYGDESFVGAAAWVSDSHTFRIMLVGLAGILREEVRQETVRVVEGIITDG